MITFSDGDHMFYKTHMCLSFDDRENRELSEKKCHRAKLATNEEAVSQGRARGWEIPERWRFRAGKIMGESFI